MRTCFYVSGFLIVFSVIGVARAALPNSSSIVLAVNTEEFVIPKKSAYKDLKLKVPYYNQQYPNSCEAASLRMALAYRGIYKKDMDIVKAFGYNPTYKDWTNSIWTDPQKQYVGYVNIAGRPYGGYGVYGLPVVKATEGFGRTAVYATGTAITAQFLAREIDAGNPVIAWGYTSITEPANFWTTKDGTTVKALRGEHVRVIVGYKGTIEKPLGFYVSDPFTGEKQKYWTTEKLMAHMQKVPGVTDQAVVVK